VSKLSPRLLIPIGLIVLFGLATVFRKGPAAMPAQFETSVTLTAAKSRSVDDNRPVIAFVTADWCGPCQSMKKSSLSDPEIVEFMKSKTLPVYIDATDANPEVDLLGVTGFPTLIAIRDNKEISRLEGAVPTTTLREWLNQVTK